MYLNAVKCQDGGDEAQAVTLAEFLLAGGTILDTPATQHTLTHVLLAGESLHSLCTVTHCDAHVLLAGGG